VNHGVRGLRWERVWKKEGRLGTVDVAVQAAEEVFKRRWGVIVAIVVT
jgi:hypothetical protein